MPDASWGSRCATDSQLKTVTIPGWEFNTPSHPGTSTDGFRREDIRLRVRAEVAPIVAYLGRSTADFWGGVRKGATWGTVCRKIRGGSKLSNHSFGLALDFSSDRGPMVKRKSEDLFDPRINDWPPEVVLLWEAWGWRWGGKYGTTYQGRSGSNVVGFPPGLKGIVGRTVDAMHIEYMGSKNEANALAPKATELFLAGRWGCAPDGTPILPTAAPELEEWEMALETAEIEQIITANYVGIVGRRPDANGLKVWTAEFKNKGYPVALAKLQRGLFAEWRKKMAAAYEGK